MLTKFTSTDRMKMWSVDWRANEITIIWLEDQPTSSYSPGQIPLLIYLVLTGEDVSLVPSESS